MVQVTPFWRINRYPAARYVKRDRLSHLANCPVSEFVRQPEIRDRRLRRKEGGMGKPLKWTPGQKLPLVLSVLRGEGSVAEIARRHQVSDVTLGKGRGGLLAGGGAAAGKGG